MANVCAFLFFALLASLVVTAVVLAWKTRSYGDY